MTTPPAKDKRVVLVNFRGSARSYAYFTDIEDLEVGDYVEVTVRNQKEEVVVTKLDGITAQEAGFATKWIDRKIEEDEEKPKAPTLEDQMEAVLSEKKEDSNGPS